MLAKTESIITHGDWLARADRVAAEIAAHAAAHDRDDSFVEEGFAALKREGFFSALVPAEFGGGGASTATICEAIRVIARACSSTARTTPSTSPRPPTSRPPPGTCRR